MSSISEIFKTTLDEIKKPDPLQSKDIIKYAEIRGTIQNDFGRCLADFLNLDFDRGPWLAGGMLRKLYLLESPGESDWDIFFNNDRQFQQARKSLSNESRTTKLHESENAVTYEYLPRRSDIYTFSQDRYKIQLIKKSFYSSPKEVIDNFDLTICQLVTDGNKMLVGDNTIRDLKSKTIRLSDPSFITRKGLIKRLIKYIVYGYKLDPSLYELTKQHYSTLFDVSNNNNEYDDV